MQLCPQIAIEPISWAQAKQRTDGTCFLLHTSHASGADIGHAYGLKLVQAAMRIYSSTEEERIQTNASLLLDKLQNVPGIYIFNVHVLLNGDPAAKRRKKEYATSIELQLKAGMECDSEETSWERLRMQLKDSMRKEVDREITRLRSEEGCLNPRETYKCTLCPWRKFSRRSYLLTHVQKYHKPEKDFVTTKYQFHVACAIFEQKQALSALAVPCVADEQLICQAAQCIRWPKVCPQAANCTSVDKMLYITNVFVAKAIKHKGKIHSMFNDITMEWVMASTSVKNLRDALVNTATDQKEWLICSHDVNTTHSIPFWGVPGPCRASASRAQKDLPTFVQPLPKSSQYVFSDNPAFVEGANAVLPNLVAVAEDALHLVLRVEACTGEKRTSLSSRLLRVMKRFRLPCPGPFYHGRTNDDDCDQAHWSEDFAEEDVPGDWNWDDRVVKPYSSHQEYIDDVQVLCAQHFDQMHKKDKKGRTIEQILRAGVSYKHFRYLWNGSHIIEALHHAMDPKEVELLSFGTCSNEALHFQLKACQEQIIQQRIQTFPPQLEAISLAKLLAHHSAAYHPTLAQRKESEILSLMQGRLIKGFVLCLEERQIGPTLCREALRKPVHSLDPRKVAARKALKAKKAEQWQKEVKNRKLKHPHRGQVVVRKEVPRLPRLKQGEVSFPLFGQGQADLPDPAAPADQIRSARSARSTRCALPMSPIQPMTPIKPISPTKPITVLTVTNFDPKSLQCCLHKLLEQILKRDLVQQFAKSEGDQRSQTRDTKAAKAWADSTAIGAPSGRRGHPTRAFTQGKVNLNLDGSIVTSRHMPEPMLEANEATTLAIQDCLDEGCSVEALMDLDQKLARDEAKVKVALDELHDLQSQEFSEDSAEQIAWLKNFLDRCASLRAQLMAVKTLEAPDFASQLMRAAAVAFGGGRHGDYPKA
ncbi:Uncharacterized protein SCF082_LOCUS36965 [Durusdinium trenchii]|uniref:C2H2-type domain-containing protein n=1 Tax=Durusdinium trenchii TaxID=1381693 RepID=A0ABP0PMN0_9DINO